MVFQNYALYPHMTVGDNLGFGLRLRKVPKAERLERVREVAEILGLEELLARKPGELSGGQRQRVAMGRAMVREPKAFLMDEPLSNLDAKLRVSMRAELARLHERLGVTTVYVTHDQVEAMTLGQRVAVLRDGMLQQVDTPQTLFRAAGEPLRGGVHRLAVDEPRRRVRRRRRASASPGSTFRSETRPASRASAWSWASGRPTSWTGRSRARPSAASCACARRGGSRRGVPRHLPGRRAEGVCGRRARGSGRADPDDAALLADDQRALFTARVDAHRAVGPGEEIELAVDPARLHFFDPETGDVLGR